METIQRIEQVPINKANLRVIYFIQDSDDVCDGQERNCLNIIQAGSPIFRHQLVTAVAPMIVSTKTVSQVVSFVLGRLIFKGCIRVETFEEFTKKLEKGQQK